MDVLTFVCRMLEKRSLSYADGPIPVPTDDLLLMENVERICISETSMYSSVLVKSYSLDKATKFLFKI